MKKVFTLIWVGEISIEETVLVPLVSLIGMIIAIILNYRSMRIRFELESRAGYIQEVLRDMYRLVNYLRQITMGQDIRGNVEKIQELLNERPYNFKFKIINEWVEVRYELEKSGYKLEKSGLIERVTKLMMDVMNKIHLYEEKYTKILGIKEKYEYLK
ncbi:MAG: hypothetical protein ACTSXC_05260 [Candidatus Freyarchaeota archaeon]